MFDGVKRFIYVAVTFRSSLSLKTEDFTMVKKNISIFLILCMLISLFPQIAYAETVTNTFGNNLTWTLDDEGTLTISGTGEIPDYTEKLAAPWDNKVNKIKAIVIKNGIT